ncbi:hypothetical protein EAE99_011296 [Botrytis elliptica]|nr:hypothetical protein EAE99_011296 [Botrytis elliptica]
MLLQNANWNLEDKSHAFEQIKSLAENLYAPQMRAYSSLKDEFKKLSIYADTAVVGGRSNPMALQKEKLQREKLITVYVIYFHDAQQEAIAHLMSEPERIDLGSAELWKETLKKVKPEVLRELLSVKSKAVVVSIMMSDEWSRLSGEERQNPERRIEIWGNWARDKANLVWMFWSIRNSIDLGIIFDSVTPTNFPVLPPNLQSGLQQILKNKVIWALELLYTTLDIEPPASSEKAWPGDTRSIYAQWAMIKSMDVIRRFDDLVDFNDFAVTHTTTRSSKFPVRAVLPSIAAEGDEPVLGQLM